MSEGKWLGDLRGDMPVVLAARQVLLARLTPVRDRLPQAVSQADEDVEHVHQLRVATRRAGAAVRIFVGCLPHRTFDKVRKKLRRIRRGAGAARDWDVFLDALRERLQKAPAGQHPGLDLLLGIAQGQRMAAQEALVQATTNSALDLDKLITETIADLKNPSRQASTLKELAVPLLTEHVQDLNQAVQGDLHNYEHLHQVRITGKRLRYAMEIFGSCFDSSFREEIYPAVEEMQEILGQANDSHVAAGRLEAIRARVKATQPERWKRYRPGLETLLRYHKRALPQRREQFVKWWKKWQQTEAEALRGLLE